MSNSIDNSGNQAPYSQAQIAGISLGALAGAAALGGGAYGIYKGLQPATDTVTSNSPTPTNTIPNPQSGGGDEAKAASAGPAEGGPASATDRAAELHAFLAAQKAAEERRAAGGPSSPPTKLQAFFADQKAAKASRAEGGLSSIPADAAKQAFPAAQGESAGKEPFKMYQESVAKHEAAQSAKPPATRTWGEFAKSFIAPAGHTPEHVSLRT